MATNLSTLWRTLPAFAALVKRDCMSCHGSEVYTRPNRMVNSLDGLRHQMGHEGRARVERDFDVRKQCAKLEQIYAKLC